MDHLKNIRMATEEEDNDMYSFTNDRNSFFDTENLEEDDVVKEALKTSAGKRPPMTSMRRGGPMKATAGALGGKMPPSSMGRLNTGALNQPMEGPRPMTGIAGIGYKSAPTMQNVMRFGAGFDPISNGGSIYVRANIGVDDGREEKMKAMERKVCSLIEESILAQSKGNLSLATDLAKEAGRKERALVRQREQYGLNETINLDLTYSVLFNLAVQYETNEMYAEALNTYNVITKNKMFSNAGRIKVNMGNIYFKQGNFMKAIKFYRMALDQVPNTHKEMRIKIMQNIGSVFVKMGQYNDAATSYEHIMNEKADFKTGFNLILCYFALGDKEKMKLSYGKLLCVNLGIDDEDKYTTNPDNPQESIFLDAIKNDTLRQLERERKSQMEWSILTAAKVIAPAIEQTFAEGFDWCMEQVKNSDYLDLANDLEMHKALMYLKQRNFKRAVEILKTFEKKDTTVKCQAATNLSFIYQMQGKLAEARRYADIAVKCDRFNASSLTNQGNCLLAEGDLQAAEVLYREALENDSSCYEGLFNLGLLHKRQSNLDEALDCFLKLHNILRNNAQVMYQIASLYEQMEDFGQALEWLMQCVGIVPTDPSVLGKLAEISEKEEGGGEKSQAFHYRYDAYRLFPADIETVEWLGTYYIDSQFPEKAARYFERIAIIQPNEVKWQLMVASCFRRSGNYQQAFDKYKLIHSKFPDNIECLKFLNRLCADLGLSKELQEYANKLKKAEKHRDMRENNERGSGGSRRSSGKGARGSASSSDQTRNGSGGTSARQRRTLPDANQDAYSSSKKEIDATYSDPLGPAPERPKTAARRGNADDFDDFEVDDNLLPD